MSGKHTAALRRGLLLLGTAALFGMLLGRPGESGRAVREAMENFTTRLVPVLFPYMVLSHLFGTYGLLEPLAALLPVHKLFRMDRSAFGAFVMGQVCGYPVGASMTAELYRQRRVTKKQGELLLALSAGASPAFLLHAVGGALWGSVGFGVFLYVLQLGFALVAGGMLGRRLAGAETSGDGAGERIPFARCFCDAVGGSAVRLVSVGGYIVFFSLLSAILPVHGLLQAGLSAMLECASGTLVASSVGGSVGLFLTGFAVGCGGVSVLLQTAHMVGDAGLGLGTYCRFKLASGLFCGAGAWMWGRLVPMTALPRQTLAMPERDLYTVLFLGSWLVICLVWGRARMSGKQTDGRLV